MAEQSRESLSTRERQYGRCYQCNGRFGLIRYRFALKQFCSNFCIERHKADTGEESSRIKKWMAFLSNNS
jgi:hypothetical protein